jgi:hypothetical protein
LICRRVCRSLSSYIDKELAVFEQEIISEHLQVCASCRTEYDALLQTKRLLASLKTRVPQEEWASLLENASREGASGRGARSQVPLIRTRPLVATALLSLLGLSLGANRLTHSLSTLATYTPMSLRPQVSHSLHEELFVDNEGQGIYNRYDVLRLGPLYLTKKTQKFVPSDSSAYLAATMVPVGMVAPGYVTDNGYVTDSIAGENIALASFTTKTNYSANIPAISKRLHSISAHSASVSAHSATRAPFVSPPLTYVMAAGFSR